MSVLDWIYPPTCMACHNILPVGNVNFRREKERHLCTACEGLLTPIAPPVCPRCGHPSQVNEQLCTSCQGKHMYFEYNRAVYAYEDLIRELIHEMKFRNRKPIADGLGMLLADAFAEQDMSRFGFFVPVPMYPRKQRKRGFNQAEIMAAALSKRTGVPLAADLLIRVRDTPPQSGLSHHQRTENMADAFRLNTRDSRFDIKNKKICLIDDIYTTGSTLNACAKILQYGGAVGISCITFAIAVKNNVI